MVRRGGQEGGNGLGQGGRRLLLEPGVDEEGGVRRVRHVAALDHDLRHRGQIQPTEVVAGHDAVHAVVIAHRHGRFGQEGTADVFPQKLGGADDGIVHAAGHRFEDREASTVDRSSVGVDGHGH